MYSDPEKQKEYCRNRMREKRKDPAYREQHAKYMKEYGRWWSRLKKYGISKERYLELLEAQGGCCAICKQPDQNLRVDHCHVTKTIRGLLCDACNLGIGKLKDDPAVLRAAADYLEKVHG